MPRPLAYALIAGLALRLGMAVAVRSAPLTWDATEYAGIARGVAERGEFALKPGVPTAGRPPLYPLFLVPFARLCPGSWLCARLAQALLDASTIVWIYFFGLFAFRERRFALAGAVLYALHPVFIAYSAEILTEALFVWCWLAAVCLLLRCVETPAETRGDGAAALAGLAMGLAILCRPNFIFFPPGAAAALLLFHRERPRLLRRMAVMLVCAYATLVPWTLRNKRVMGAWIPVATGGGPALWTGAQVPLPDITPVQARVNEGRTEIEADAEFYRLAKLEYRRNWRAVAQDMPRRFVRFWLTSHSAVFGSDEPLSVYRAEGRWGPVATRAVLWGLQLSILALAAWGLWSARRAWNPAATLTVCAFGYYSLHLFTGYWTNRYHLPALALLTAVAGATALRLAGERTGRAARA